VCPRGAALDAGHPIRCYFEEMCCINTDPTVQSWYKGKDIAGICVRGRGTDGYFAHENRCPNNAYGFRYAKGENRIGTVIMFALCWSLSNNDNRYWY